jgi:F-type H+-transporting ATPase subunit epsilon
LIFTVKFEKPMTEFQIVVVTPEKTALEQNAEMVTLPAIDGELGVMANHAPLIARLGFGEMRITSANTTTNYYVDGGFAQIAENVVSVLSGRAIAASEINVKDVQKQLDAAEAQETSDPAQEALRRRAIAQARAQLKIASK